MVSRFYYVPNVGGILGVGALQRDPQVSVGLFVLLGKYRGRPYRQGGGASYGRCWGWVSGGFVRPFHEVQVVFLSRVFSPWGSDNSHSMALFADTSGTGRGVGVAAPVTVLCPCGPTSFYPCV